MKDKTELIAFLDLRFPNWREVARVNPIDKFILVVAYYIEEFIGDKFLKTKDYKGFDDFIEDSYENRSHSIFGDSKIYIPYNNKRVREIAQEIYNEVG